MKLQQYIDCLSSRVNEPVTLTALMKPFDLHTCSLESPCLLIGHVLDDLQNKLSLEQEITELDVAYFAWDLGHEPAYNFLVSILSCSTTW